MNLTPWTKRIIIICAAIVLCGLIGAVGTGNLTADDITKIIEINKG